MISITYFDHGINWFKEPRKKRIAILGIAFLTIIIYSISLWFPPKIAELIELGYSLIMLITLMGGLFISFFLRKLYFISFISLLVISVVMIGQILSILNSGNEGEYFYMDEIAFLASYSLLSTLIISLAFSWIIEKATLIPYTREILDEIEETAFVNQLLGLHQEDPEALKTSIRNALINKNKIDEVLTFLIKFSSTDKYSDMLKTAIIRKSEFLSLKLNLQNGIITNEDFNKQTSQIQHVILDLIDENIK